MVAKCPAPLCELKPGADGDEHHDRFARKPCGVQNAKRVSFRSCQNLDRQGTKLNEAEAAKS